MIISCIILIICLMVAFQYKEKFDNNLTDNLANVFTGVWIYNYPNSKEERLTIEYAGQNTLLDISKTTKSSYITSEEPPTFRFIPIGPTKIQLISTSPTYAFPATNMEYVETKRGPAIIFQGKTYYGSEGI